MKTTTPLWARPDRPANRSLRLTFGFLWLTDLVATVCLFLVPFARELNPITIFFYESIGLTGVVLAGTTYAALVVLTGSFLRKPIDGLFVAGAVSVYAVCATNNVVLLVTRVPIVQNMLL
ncbi:hypothetical protein [Natrinema salinisoli]|uniref:hypothetical protein n=1 Tax=Natrinema salinisoli TaxID=2878535 RepID=UPI001CF0C426|nr:hypothetical protein [Natrinema salinisoli]